MGLLFRDWQLNDPHNFSQLRPSHPSTPFKMTPATYHPMQRQTLPPPDQVITTETKNILLRHMYQNDEGKLRQKRAAPEHGSKQLRGSVSDNANQA